MSITILWWHIPAVITILLLLWGALSHSNAPFGDFDQLIAIVLGISVVWNIGILFK